MVSKVIFNNPKLRGIATVNQSGEVIGFINFARKGKGGVCFREELLEDDVQSHIESCIKMTMEMDNKIKSILAS